MRLSKKGLLVDVVVEVDCTAYDVRPGQANQHKQCSLLATHACVEREDNEGPLSMSIQ